MTTPFFDHKQPLNQGATQPFYELPVGEQAGEVEFRLAPPIPPGTPISPSDPTGLLISYDPSAMQAYLQSPVGGFWHTPMPIDGVSHGTGAPPPTTVNDRLYVDFATGDLYVAWDDLGTKQWKLATTTQLWTDDGTYLRPTLATQTNSVVIDDVTGNVGIDGLPVAGFSETVNGPRLLMATTMAQARDQRVFGVNQMTTVDLQVGPITSVNNFVEIVTDLVSTPSRNAIRVFSDGAPAIDMTFSWRFAGGVFSAAQCNSSGNLLANCSVGLDAGLFKICIHIPTPSPSASRLLVSWMSPVTATNATTWTVSPLTGTAPAWVGTPITSSTILGTDATNRFGNVAIGGQIISPLRTAFATISASGALPADAIRVMLANTANITITLPDPALNVGRELWFTRTPTSTGTVTLAPAAGQVQDLAGTLGATTTITALGNSDSQSVHFWTDGSNWYR